MRRARQILGWVFVGMLVVSIGAIWLLTEQSAADTSELSGSVAAAIDAKVVGAGEQAGAVAPGIAVNRQEGTADSATSTADADRQDAASAGQGTGDAAQTDAGAANPSPSYYARLKAKVKAKLARLAVWTARHVRRVAHTVEFAFVGRFVSAAAVCLLPFGPRSWCTRLIALAFCAVWSLVDQTHKLFVPGRHFDPVDLVFDAAGYLAASALVFAATEVVAALKQAHRCH